MPSNRSQDDAIQALRSVLAADVNIVDGTTAAAVGPGGKLTFTYKNPIDNKPHVETGSAMTACSPGKITAFRTTDGRWFVVGASFAHQVRERVLQLRHRRPVPEERGGLIMWLDCNWVGPSSPHTGSAFQLFQAMIQKFQTKKLYTLPSDDDRIYGGEAAIISLDDPTVAAFLDEKNITVVRTPIEEARGCFFMPLLGRREGLAIVTPIPTDAEFAALRRLAKRYGAMVCGEWQSWLAYDRAVIRGLKLPGRVTIVGDTPDQDDYRVVGGGFPRLTLTGSAQAFFGGLNSDEKLVINQQQNAVFAFFRKL